MIILYVIFSIIIILVLIKFFIRLKYKFWAFQPVFHYYDILYWVYPSGIINKELPKVNKFCNFLNITVTSYEDRSDHEIIKVVQFIQDNYYKELDINYTPTIDSFKTYFVGNNVQPLISTYYTLGTSISEKELIGTMTTRPLYITFKEKKTFGCNYVDYLCVHKEYRKKNIAPEVIQTHEYVMRHMKINPDISLFKREGEITGIVPFIAYKTYMFDLSNLSSFFMFNKHNKLHASMKIIKINKLNINLLINFILNQKSNFDCFILPNIGNLRNLIVNKIYIVYGIIIKNELISCYFYRDSYMTYKSGKSVELFASINSCDYNIFICGFIDSILNYVKNNDIKYLTIENISNNNIILKKLKNYSIIPILKNPTAYFFYNYITKPKLSNNICILA